jgi:hypothetical protein
MGDRRHSGSCLKAASGELVCLRNLAPEAREKKPEGAFPSISTFSALIRSIEFPEFGVALQLVRVTPGSELGALEQLRDEDGVIASLNHLGGPAAFWTFGRKEPLPTESWMLGSEDYPTAGESPGGNHARVLVVDVDPTHCQGVMRAIAEGTRCVPDSQPVEIIGRSLELKDATLATLYDYVTLLLRSSLIGGDIVAVNMSVDWGIACDQGAPLSDEVSTASVSFPFFEHVLKRVRQHLVEIQGGSTTRVPAFFAAAGNKRDGDLRWRMAYPAVRPDVIAATFISLPTPSSRKREGVPLASVVDCPAVFDVKPCFGVNEDVLPRELRAGSSFACAWLAGYYAAHATKQSCGHLKAVPTFSKIATLQSSGEVCLLATRTSYWARPAVSILTDSPVIQPRTPLTGLLDQLNGLDADVEFVATGSSAMVDVLLSGVPEKAWRLLSTLDLVLGDVDIVQSAPLKSSKHAELEKLVSDWLRTKPDLGYRGIDLCPLERRLSAPMLAQCVVPASQLLITAAGVVDATGGRRDIEERRLRIHIPGNRRVWDLNPQFLSASMGTSVGILLWINLSLVLQIVSHELGLSHTCSLEPDSTDAVRAALVNQTNDLDAVQEGAGMNMPAGKDRYLRRMNRARSLVKRAENRGIDVSVQSGLIETMRCGWARLVPE